VGIIDRFAKAVAAQIEKAPSLTPIATMTEAEMRQSGISTTQYGYGTNVPLPRDMVMPTIPFSPGQPLIPSAINPIGDRGRPDPRRYEYLVAQNINVTENRLVPFGTLRAAADQIDIVRRCIEVLKAKLTGMDWDIVLGNDATEKIIAEQGVNQVRAQSIAKIQFNDEINRLRQFWEQPDKVNGLVFADWLSMALEEILVLDAWAVWAQKSVGGDCLALQILDGSTIKPLIDDRGMRPSPPNPAFQQVLYGFPRTEFAATDESEEADGEFSSDELQYMIRNRRAMTVYGFSPVERSLALADIYIRRQQWLRKEYTDGVLPELMFETDATFGNNPDLLRAYENIFNDDLAGVTEQRKRARILPGGLHPVQFEGYGERFKDTLDEYLVNSICGHFGVQPSEIGFAPKGGLGGAGHQQGQSESSEVIGVIPLANWLSKMLTNMSYVYLGMPRELEFKIMPSARNETADMAQRTEIQIKSGELTINEARSRQGLPLLDAREADMPMVVAGTATFFISDEGLISVGQSAASGVVPDIPENNTDNTSQEVKPQPEPDATARQEVKSFLKWLKKPRTRPFDFEHLDSGYAETLNKFVIVEDIDGARWYAERYLGV
jgi:hypothetical protein